MKENELHALIDAEVNAKLNDLVKVCTVDFTFKLKSALYDWFESQAADVTPENIQAVLTKIFDAITPELGEMFTQKTFSSWNPIAWSDPIQRYLKTLAEGHLFSQLASVLQERVNAQLTTLLLEGDRVRWEYHRFFLQGLSNLLVSYLQVSHQIRQEDEFTLIFNKVFEKIAEEFTSKSLPKQWEIRDEVDLQSSLKSLINNTCISIDSEKIEISRRVETARTIEALINELRTAGMRIQNGPKNEWKHASALLDIAKFLEEKNNTFKLKNNVLTFEEFQTFKKELQTCLRNKLGEITPGAKCINSKELARHPITLLNLPKIIYNKAATLVSLLFKPLSSKKNKPFLPTLKTPGQKCVAQFESKLEKSTMANPNPAITIQLGVKM